MGLVGEAEVREFLKKQTLVKYWIEEVLKVRLGDDLIQSLKNGIVLCYLISEIDPFSVPKIQVYLFLFLFKFPYFITISFFKNKIKQHLL